MSHHFLVTSGLAKHYHPEVGTPKVDALWGNPAARLFISRLGVVETVSVIARRVRSGLISAAEFSLLWRRFFTTASAFHVRKECVVIRHRKFIPSVDPFEHVRSDPGGLASGPATTVRMTYERNATSESGAFMNR